MSHPSVAASVRRAKEANPSLFCAARGCLWRVVNARTGELTPCRKHGSTCKEIVKPA